MSKIKIPRIPPLLAQRLEKFEAHLPPEDASWDRVFVYPLGEKTERLIENGVATSMTTTKGGLYVPKGTEDVYNAQVGMIVSMGPQALEQCYSVGYELGHIIVTNRLSRWEKRYFAGGREHAVLICNAGDITGGRDIAVKLRSGEAWYEMDTETGRVEFNPGDGPKERLDPAPRDDGTV